MQTIGTPLLWVGFGIVILLVLIFDLGVLPRNAHEVKFREAAPWSFIWAMVAVAFGGFVYFQFGTKLALQYYTGWVIEQSLSVGNLVVMVVVMGYFAVPASVLASLLIPKQSAETA